MAAPTFELWDIDGSQIDGTTVSRKQYQNASARINFLDGSFSTGATGDGANPMTLRIAWTWEDSNADYTTQTGGWNAAFYAPTAGTFDLTCTVTNADGDSTSKTVEYTVSADARTDFWCDGVGSGSTDGSSEVNAAASFESQDNDANVRIIVTADVTRTAAESVFLLGVDSIIEFRNGAAMNIATDYTPNSIFRMLDGSTAINYKVRGGHTTQNQYFIGLELFRTRTGMTIIGADIGGNVSQGFTNGHLPTDTSPTGDTYVQGMTFDGIADSYMHWTGNATTSGTASQNAARDVRMVVFRDCQFTPGSRGEACTRGSGSHIYTDDLTVFQETTIEAASDYNWDESEMLLYGPAIPANYDGGNPPDIGNGVWVDINSGTGVTAGFYRATGIAQKDGGSEYGFVLRDSPSTSNVDLTNDDIDVSDIGTKEARRIMGGGANWSEGTTFKGTEYPTRSGAFIALEWGPQSTTGDAEYDVFRRCLIQHGDTGLELGGDHTNLCFSACVFDGIITTMTAVGSPTTNSVDGLIFAQCTSIGEDVDCIRTVSGDNILTGARFINHREYITGRTANDAGSGGALWIQPVQDNLLSEVFSNGGEVTNCIISPYEVDGGGANWNADTDLQEMFYQDDDAGSGETFYNITEFNALSFASGNVVALVSVDSTTYAPATDATAASTPFAPFDYNGVALSGDVTIGAVSIVASAPAQSNLRRGCIRW